jgi:hypothetical protein
MRSGRPSAAAARTASARVVTGSDIAKGGVRA